MEGNLAYATFYKMIKGPRASKISWKAALWPICSIRLGISKPASPFDHSQKIYKV